MTYTGFKNNCICNKENCLCLPVCETCNQETCLCHSDNPFWDGTDASHPAWWRGQEYGFRQAMKRFSEWLDDKGLNYTDHPDIEVIKRKLIEKIK